MRMLDLRLIASIILIPLQNSDDTSAALGGSLADIAAFMQEVEIRQGWTPRPDDGRGIERARQLAKRLLDETATAVCAQCAGAVGY